MLSRCVSQKVGLLFCGDGGGEEEDFLGFCCVWSFDVLTIDCVVVGGGLGAMNGMPVGMMEVGGKPTCSLGWNDRGYILPLWSLTGLYLSLFHVKHAASNKCDVIAFRW